MLPLTASLSCVSDAPACRIVPTGKAALLNSNVVNPADHSSPAERPSRASSAASIPTDLRSRQLNFAPLSSSLVKPAPCSSLTLRPACRQGGARVRWVEEEEAKDAS